MNSELIKKIAVTFEMCGGVDLSDAAIEMIITDLEQYPPAAVSKALDRCRSEVRGRMSPADIIQRIDDGRPGADEAWALCPSSEAESTVWTTEIAQAFETVRLMTDRVAARRSFIGTYQRLTTEARGRGEPVKWTPSLGHDPNGRERAIRAAVDAGRLTSKRADMLLPGYSEPENKQLPEHTGPVDVGSIIDSMGYREQFTKGGE